MDAIEINRKNYIKKNNNKKRRRRSIEKTLHQLIFNIKLRLTNQNFK